MARSVREPEDDTVARLAPEPADVPEICAELRSAYLEEKLLSQSLLALTWRREPGWTPALARQMGALAEGDGGHARAVAQALEEVGGTPPERPETAHPPGRKDADVRPALLKALQAKKKLEIHYVRAASLAEVEGRGSLSPRLETLAREEAAGRQTLLTILTRLPASRPEE